MPEYRPDETADLPDLTAILVVDAEKFSRHDDRQQDELARLIPEVLEDACHRCGLEELWEQRMFPDSTGDGYLIGFPPAFLTRLIDRYFDSLQKVLAEKADRLRARQMRLRMRLSVHLGPARVLDGVDSPVGTAMITTHRLVDAGPLRVLLDRSDPDATLLAVALSERVMTDVVTAGHTRRLKSSQFVECPLEIAGKAFKTTAFLHVPVVSGELLRTGLIGAFPQEPIAVQPSPGERRKAPRPGVVAGRDVDQSSHTTNVQGNQYRAGRNLTIGRDAR
ncbi:hypothetical protein Ait01nite_004810 [Actinoplanes italicus]|uniref:Guanylate cyclase domain-containing protein n=1 Tax=Actinoplanes italicus TaxID=113567 RepID=A0A2T0KMG7_9ACTN|nr:hypothetical protein [Actinoplanes italicus]PRX24835.1 hypothetical protein CLV67_102615 [Actinoplanes italicus]GIE27436.1 hypothetical protein Ait01nite_004810 [Actinoplanes italicus]